MQRADRAELRGRVARTESLERAFRTETGALPGDFLDLRDKPGIQREAHFSERHHRNHPRTFRHWRQYPRAGPGGFLARLLTVKESHAHPGTREFQGDSPANDSAPRNDRIELLHVRILSHPNPRYLTRAVLLESEPGEPLGKLISKREALRTIPGLFWRDCARGSNQRLEQLHARP